MSSYLLLGDAGGPVRRLHSCFDPLLELVASHEQHAFPPARHHQHVVLVLALLAPETRTISHRQPAARLGSDRRSGAHARSVPERRRAVAVLRVVRPLALVAEAVGPLADAEAAASVVLPLATVELAHVLVNRLLLKRVRRGLSKEETRTCGRDSLQQRPLPRKGVHAPYPRRYEGQRLQRKHRLRALEQRYVRAV